MTGKPAHQSYRIGDFAEYMGVTPDFLKHYQVHGLLDVRKKANGYRYYNFDQASRILEYMRLRNYGVTVREMHEMLTADMDEAIELLDAKVEELERQVVRLEAVIREHKTLRERQRERTKKPVDWEVREVEGCYFLPHSVLDRFIDDNRIPELLKSWMQWLPIAKSAMHIAPTGALEQPYETRWGLVLPESVVRRLEIPLGDVVEYTPPRKAFIWHFLAEEEAFAMDRIAQGIHPVFDAMRSLNLKAAGDFHLVVEMKLINLDGSRRGGCGRFVIGLADELAPVGSR